MNMKSKHLDTIQKAVGKEGKYNKMEIMPTKIVAKNGRFDYDNMQLNIGNTPYNMVGRNDLITRSIAGTKLITPYTTSRTINVGEEDTPGRIVIPFKGTIDNPKPDLAGILEQNLEGVIKDVLKEELGGEGELKDKIGDILNNL